MLVSNPFLSTVYQFGQTVMQDYWLTFLMFKNDVFVLSSMLPSRYEPYRYFINLDGYLLRVHPSENHAVLKYESTSTLSNFVQILCRVTFYD